MLFARNYFYLAKILTLFLFFESLTKIATGTPSSPGNIIFKNTYPQKGVIFSHNAHNLINCTKCHPNLFTRKAGKTRTSMKEMEQGKYCGFCHNGKSAFSMKSNCNTCHTYIPSNNIPQKASIPKIKIKKAYTQKSKYVGSKKCKACHPTKYNKWKKTKKATHSWKAYASLARFLTNEEKISCLKCHTTGYGKEGGFINEQLTPNMKNLGCEACHGPGELHIKAKKRYKKTTININKDVDTKGRLTDKSCEECHTEEWNKAFNFYPMIHSGAH